MKAIIARGERGNCRHCDGPTPCWSQFGDCVPGLSYRTRDRIIRWIRANRRRGALPAARRRARTEASAAGARTGKAAA